MAGNGSADDIRSNREYGVDALAELLASRGGHRDVKPAPLPPARPAPQRPASVPSSSTPDDTQLLAKASQLADSLQGRVHELDRREQQIAEMMRAFEQEQRRFRLTQQERQDESLGRETQLTDREQQFGQSLQQGQQLLGELERREQEIAHSRVAVEQERGRLKSEVDRELDVERSALKHAKNLLETERKDLNARIEKLREEQQENLRQMRRDLEIERRRLRSQTAADVDTERESLKREREDWTRTRAEQEAFLMREKESQTTALQRVERQLADEQRRQAESSEQRRSELEKHFAECRSKLDAERRQWDVQKSAADEDIGRQRFLNVETLRRIEDERASREQQLQASLQRLKDEHSRGIQTERMTFDAELQRRRDQFVQEIERTRERFQIESTQQREQQTEERRKFDENLLVERERLAAERRTAQADADQQTADWTKHRDQQLQLIAHERQELERAAIQAETELAQRRQQLEDECRQARDASLIELRSNWDVERQDLRRQLASDIESERKRLTDEIKEFEQQQEREQDSLKRTRESQESAIKQARTELINDKQAFNEELKRERATHEAHCATLRGQFELGLRAQFAETELRVARELESLTQQKDAHQKAVADVAARLAADRKQLDDARVMLVDEHRQQAESLAAWERKLQSESHTQTVLTQQWQRRVTETNEQHRRRRSQLDRYRELLAERELSLNREEELLARSKQAFETEQAQDRDRLTEQREMLDRQGRELLEEHKQAESAMARDSEKLKERGLRLEGLRKELEHTSLRNLEDRLAAEEALAEFIARTGEPAARQRVDEVRVVIAGQIREMTTSSNRTQAEETARLVAFTQQQVEEEAARLKKERETFTRRVHEREQELHEQESRLESKTAEWQQRESTWRHMRDSWLQERVNAEQIIRSLLDELSSDVQVAAK